ncbi:hypothetical protein IAT40_002598 [Kwoniella sp. CBS 6097]
MNSGDIFYDARTTQQISFPQQGPCCSFVDVQGNYLPEVVDPYYQVTVTPHTIKLTSHPGFGTVTIDVPIQSEGENDPNSHAFPQTTDINAESSARPAQSSAAERGSISVGQSATTASVLDPTSPQETSRVATVETRVCNQHNDTYISWFDTEEPPAMAALDDFSRLNVRNTMIEGAKLLQKAYRRRLTLSNGARTHTSVSVWGKEEIECSQHQEATLTILENMVEERRGRQDQPYTGGVFTAPCWYDCAALKSPTDRRAPPESTEARTVRLADHATFLSGQIPNRPRVKLDDNWQKVVNEIHTPWTKDDDEAWKRCVKEEWIYGLKRQPPE